MSGIGKKGIIKEIGKHQSNFYESSVLIVLREILL